MQLVQQVVLVYEAGRTERVYEIDLCEMSPERYVVNFRYGRRGTRLKEGVRTVQPVSRTEAERVLQQLVDTQLQKGYRRSGEAPVAPVLMPSVATPPVLTPPLPAQETRAQLILRRLATPDRSVVRLRLGRFRRQAAHGSLERLIWRAGELQLTAAAPRLLSLLGTGNALRDYCLAGALGWCGDASAIEPLARLYTTQTTPEMVRRIACEALLKLSDDATKAAFRDDLIEQLPRELHDLVRHGPGEALTATLNAYVHSSDAQRCAVLETLYLVDNEHVRPALLEVVRTVPLQPPYFRILRHIFKAAEYRRDAEVFGWLAYRFQQRRATQDRRAYSTKTRVYLLRRVWRTLRRLGQLGDTDYVKMAVGVLLPYTDADAEPPRERAYYNGRTRTSRHVHWDAYAPYLAFNHILYQHSARYVLPPRRSIWRCRPPYTPGGPEPARREEAFPHLWEQMPIGLMHLLADSQCQPVHDFAVKALRACPAFCARLDLEAMVTLLARPYDITVGFGVELATQRYQADTAPPELLLALVNCSVAAGRTLAQAWIDAQRQRLLGDSQFLASLVVSPHADTRAFARHLLRSAALPTEVARALIGRLIASLMVLTEAESVIAQEAAETIFLCFGPQLRTLGMDVLGDILAHPLPTVQEFGGNLLLQHDVQAQDLPNSVLLRLLEAVHAPLRDIGLRLLGALSDTALLSRDTLLLACAVHPLAEVRSAIRPVIRRLGAAEVYPAFVANLTERCLEVLLARASHTGLHHDLAAMLRDDVQGWMASVGRDTALRLLGVPSTAAQEVGGLLLSGRSPEWSEAFDIAELVPLSNHEVRAVRQAAWALFAQLAHRCRQATNAAGYQTEMAKAIRLLDAKWDDTREHWLAFFQQQFQAEDYTPEVLVSICDSPRATVQQFGRTLITSHFQDADGLDYMLKLSEHPAAEMQLFVTNYLERYAADNLERLRQLTPYCTSVLSLVNRGRVARRRVLDFLVAEALKSIDTAQLVADILTRQSLTMAIGDKATMIEALLKIHRGYPQVPVPLQIQPVEVRHAV